MVANVCNCANLLTKSKGMTGERTLFCLQDTVFGLQKIFQILDNNI